MTFEHYSNRVSNQDCLELFNMGAASRDAEIERLKTVPMRYRRLAFNAKLQDEIDSLNKQGVLMRDALEKIADNHGSYGPFPEANNPLWGPMAIVTAREALDATADLSGVILCHAEPVATVDEDDDNKWATLADNIDIKRGTPLYRAWEPKP